MRTIQQERVENRLKQRKVHQVNNLDQLYAARKKGWY